MFDYKNEEYVMLMVDRGDYAGQIISAIIPEDFTGKSDEIADLLREYMNLIPSVIEIFVYEDDLLRQFENLPKGARQNSVCGTKKSGAPENDRGWPYMIVAFFIEKYVDTHRREPTDDEVISFFNENKDMADSSRSQISDETLRRELAELKRRRGALAERFENKFPTK